MLAAVVLQACWLMLVLLLATVELLSSAYSITKPSFQSRLML